MRGLIIVLSFILLNFVNAQDTSKKDSEKIYTQKEFDDALEKKLKERVDKEVLVRLKRFHPKNIVNLSKEFMNKERTIELRELEVQKQKESLKASEQDLVKRAKELKGKSDKLLGCLDNHDQNQTKRVNHMVDVVSGMRPQNAADVLSVQDVDIAVRILGALAPEKVSKIFNSMDKEISARLQKQFMSMKK